MTVNRCTYCDMLGHNQSTCPTLKLTSQWRGKRVRILNSGCDIHAGYVGTVERGSMLKTSMLLIVILDKRGPTDPMDWDCCTVRPDCVEIL